MNNPLCATEEGTARYRERFAEKLAPEHFRRLQNLWVSSIGLGTYLGNHDERTDALYRQAILRAVTLGCNFIDTAINYRFQRSERNLGEALQSLFKDGKVSRDEIVIATKGGFIPFDSAPPANPNAYLMETFVKPGIITSRSEIAAGCHCMSPKYLQNQIDTSLRNLQLECVDIYYLHNPETQLEEVSRDEFLRRLGAAFETLEENVARGKIKMYGTATWNGYRVRPSAIEYLSLQEIVNVAKSVAGDQHHFRVVQLPHNLGMAEAFTYANQKVDGESLSLLEAAERLGISVVASASILQGRLSYNLPDAIAETFDGLQTDAQRSIQFVRSTPGLTAALIGMKNSSHVEENMKVATLPPAPPDKFMSLFTRDA